MKWQEINYRLFIGIIVFMLHCTNSVAEVAKLYTGNNFSSSLVNCIAQDKYKYIWIGTEHGLNRFDGYKFVKYFYDEADTTTITNDGITILFCDRNGNLWVGTNKGICRYDYEKNNFVRYYSPDHKFSANSIIQLSNGKILIGSAGRGVFIINNIHDQTLIKLEDTNRSDTDNFCSTIFLDKNNHLWMGNHSNNITKNIIEGTNITKLSEYENRYGAVIEFLTLDNTGFIVVCRHGILFYDYSTQTFSDAGYDLSPLAKNYEITTATINYREDICLGILRQGFWLIHSGSKTIVPSLSNQNHKNIATSTIYSFLDDYDKNLWIGCYQEGVVKVQKAKEVFGETAISDIPDELSDIKKLFPNSNINAAIQDENKTYYISNYGKGMIIYNPIKKQVEYMNMFQKDRKGGFLANDWINTFYIDSRQMLWIGTSSGVSCMNLADRSFIKYGWNEIFSDNTCNSICEDESGNIMLGTNRGLYYYHRKNDKIYHYPKSEQLRKLIICAMIKDKEGDIWISTSMGIWQWNRQKQVFISYINGNGLKTKEYLKNHAISLPDGKIGFRHYNGYTTFHPDEVKNNIQYLDKVYLSNITIDGKSMNCQHDYYEVGHDEGNFVLEYSLINYQSAENITFQYRIDNSKEWTTLSEGANAIYLNHVEPGKYTIEVRAMCNGVYSSTNNIVKLKVR
ncbi:MAG: two-component regulator propeller domain-containing protein, partial [Prevotellaceae bacterium]|nr:two-component regulator propeller domain-containing protein [Prevotellaceae bacterium]